MSWESFDALAGSWLAHALQASWQVALLIGGVWLVQRLAGKRLSPRWRHALWWLVALRLALPSLPTLPYAPVDWNAAEQAVDTRVAEWSPAALPLTPPTPLAETAMAADELEPLATPTSNARVTWYLPAEPVTPEPEAASPWMQRALFGLWLLGVLWSAGTLLACERRFRRRLGQARPVREPRLLEELRQEARRCGLPAAPPAFHLAGLPSPAVMGLRRGRLLLPVDFGRGLGAEARRSILRHELFHLRHRDPWQELGLRLLGTLFWFHPLVHFAFAQLRRERESLRDWEALNVDRGLAPTQYAHTLLDLVARPADDDRDARSPDSLPSNSTPLATGFLENAHDLPRRMQMITSFRPSNLRDLGLGGVALVGTAWLALASASTAELTQPETDSAAPEQAARVDLRMARIDLVPAWKQALYDQLAQPTEVTVDISQDGADGLASQLQGALDLPILTDPNDVDLEYVEIRYRAPAGQSKRAFLNTFCASANLEMSWSVSFGAILIGTADHVPQDLGQFILDATPLDESGFYLDDLVDMLPEYATGWEPWERDGTELSYIGSGQVLLRNTPEHVADIKQFCEDLLARHSPRFDAARSKRQAHLAALAGTLPNTYSAGAPADQVIRSISDARSVPIRVSGELIDLGQDISDRVSPIHLLSWMAYVDQKHLEVDERGVWIGEEFSESHPLWTNVYSLHELEDYFDKDELIQRIYWASGPDTHDYLALGEMEDLLFLRTTPSHHEAVIALLKGLEDHLGI